jgi:hypothetical protein
MVLEREMSRCEIRCGNCHRRRHSPRNEESREPRNLVPPP